MTPEGYVKKVVAVEVIFDKRCREIYRGMCKRGKVPFSLAEFADWLLFQFKGKKAGDARCLYSGEMLIAETFQIDHAFPVSRGGSLALHNLVLCSKAENLRKGDLTHFEYQSVKATVADFDPVAQKSIWRRLQIGDVQRFNYFKRKRKEQRAR